MSPVNAKTPLLGIPKVWASRTGNLEFRELSWMRVVLQIHLVSLVFCFLGADSQGGRRERYPLTSQLIEENKIPEFGLSLPPRPQALRN